MGPYYRGGYDPIPNSLEALREIAKREHFRSDPILRYQKGGRFLELGPWRGVLCSLMRDAGFEVTAIERDEACVSFLRNTIGVDAIQSVDPLETMRTMETGFDAIAAWHSMEHLPAPWLVIQEAARLLNPGGILLLAMPNPDSFEFRVLKSRWMHLDAPRHLYLFPVQPLIKLCGEQGLKLLEITTADEFSDIQSQQNWVSLARSVSNLRLIRAPLWRLFYLLGRRWQKKEGRGSAYCAVFARPAARLSQ
ncbi:MAG: class I SAM-dependent methyltransferase [Acidobacteria bacterium]|nr:class I SAM-dependent methyltransferase [Acidobacteriota bacterium]